MPVVWLWGAVCPPQLRGSRHPLRSQDVSHGRALADTGLRGCSPGRMGTGGIWGFPVGKSPPGRQVPPEVMGDTEGGTVASAEQP